jgi:plasmid replication initiation protein
MVVAFGVQIASQRPSIDESTTTAATPPTEAVERVEKAPSIFERRTRSVELVTLSEKGTGGGALVVIISGASRRVVFSHADTTAASAQAPKASTAKVGTFPQPARLLAGPKREEVIFPSEPGTKDTISAARGQ